MAAVHTLPAELLQIAELALVAPLVVGFLRLVIARLQLRRGPPLLQPYAELWKLLVAKRGTTPRTTSWVFVAAPYVVFGCYALLAWAVPPLYPQVMSLDLLSVVYVLALARFVLALAGLDTGTPFGGMGSSREGFLNVLVEPALVVIALAFSLHLHSTNLSAILAGGAGAWLSSKSIASAIALGCLWLGLALVALIDTGRLPVDNPASNMELGMMQKALHLEYSGRGLGLIEWGEAMRLTFFVLLLGDLIAPAPNGGAIGMGIGAVVLFGLKLLGSVVLKLLLGIVALAVTETFQVKLRLRRVVVPGAFAIVLGVAAVMMASIATIAGA